MSEKADDILSAALRYRRKGWSTIPIKPGTKRAAVGWKQYQEQPASDTQLLGWFDDGEYDALAVVLGEASGGLVCRDFDDLDAYEAWAARYPDLAETLPTVATSRGRHVYLRAEDLKSRKREGGEYRANGNYTLLPPSLHPDGPTYRWVVPLPEGSLPLMDPVAGGLLSARPAKQRTPPAAPPDATPQTWRRRGLSQRTYRFLKVQADRLPRAAQGRGSLRQDGQRVPERSQRLSGLVRWPRQAAGQSPGERSADRPDGQSTTPARADA